MKCAGRIKNLLRYFHSNSLSILYAYLFFWHWLFGFASKGLDPVKDADFKRWSEFGLQNRYYNPGVHLGAFALPNYVQEELQKED